MKRALWRRTNLWIATLLVLAALPLAACGGEDEAAASGAEPATVEPVEGSDDLLRITLTPKAAERLAVETVEVREEGAGSGAQSVVPYSAVLYETDGETWVYTSPEPLAFVRHRIVVETIDGDTAVLADGPPLGTEVVTVGVAELFGVENGIGADSGH